MTSLSSLRKSGKKWLLFFPACNGHRRSLIKFIKENNSTVASCTTLSDIWLCRKITCSHIFRSCITICSHDSCGHVGVMLWLVFCQTEIWELCIVFLSFRNRNFEGLKYKLKGNTSCNLINSFVFSLTESSNILDVLKSRYITLASGLWRYASPFAASRAILKRIFQESGCMWGPPVSNK